LNKKQKLEYIWKAIRKAHPKKTLVFSDGSPNNKIMIIGEAPGIDEENQGLPFVGRAGKLLIATLEKLSCPRSEFYISNVVKYRPQNEFGKTLTPTLKEIAIFRTSIEKEIEIINPKIIVLLGRIAMVGMGIKGTMGANHGKIITRDNKKILIVYHPAAILRNPNLKPIFRKDLSKIKKMSQS